MKRKDFGKGEGCMALRKSRGVGSGAYTCSLLLPLYSPLLSSSLNDAPAVQRLIYIFLLSPLLSPLSPFSRGSWCFCVSPRSRAKDSSMHFFRLFFDIWIYTFSWFLGLTFYKETMILFNFAKTNAIRGDRLRASY